MTHYPENKQVAANVNIVERDYWLNKLSGDMEKALFPYDSKKPGSAGSETSGIDFNLPAESAAKLIEISGGSDYTLHIILCAMLVILLEKYSGQEDITLATPIYKQDIEGEFINTILPLRCWLKKETTVKELLLQMKDTVEEAVKHQNYPVEILADKLEPEPSGQGFFLFDVVVLLENIQDKNYISHINPNMVFTFKRSGDCVAGEVEYNGELYKKASVQRILSHLKNLLQSALSNLDSPISTVNILSEQEVTQLLFDFNRTKKELVRDKCYSRLFEEQAAKNPDTTAAVYRDYHVTYSRLNGYANQVAHYLSGKGVMGKGNIVGLYMKSGIDILAAIIGTFKVGAAYLPIDVDFPEQRIRYILDNCKYNMLFTQTGYVKTVAGLYENILCIDEGAEAGQTFAEYPQTGMQVENNPDNLAYIIYTSGTTGKPKGVMIHQLGMINHLFAKINDLVITAADIIAQTASISFDISVWQFLSALLVGGCTHIIDKEIVYEPGRFLNILQARRITVLESVPSLITAFLEIVSQDKDNELKNLRWMIPTGETLSVPLTREWFKHYPGIKLVNAYGPTEASDDVTHYKVNEIPPETQTSIPIGKPLQNLHIYILDRHLKLCPIGVKGEICVAGIGVGKGYWQDPEKTKKAFIPNPYVGQIGDRDYALLYKTGDIGYFLDDGNIECSGRLDTQVKIRGNRIELGEIESQLKKHEHISEAVVLVLVDKGKKDLCAYFVVRSESKAGRTAEEPGKDAGLGDDSASLLRDYLSRDLPDYMIPTYFIQIDHIPLTPNGKLNRKALPKPEIKAGRKAHTAPRDRLEEKLVEIWAEVVEIDKKSISIDANFFELGGHSLKAILLTSKIHKTFEVRVNITTVFEKATIRELAEHIREAGKDSFLSIEPVEDKEYYPLSSAQNSIYIHHQKVAGYLGYNFSQVFFLNGELSKERIEGAFAKLIARHENLRTAFKVIKGEPVQIIRKKVDFKVSYYDSNEKEVKEIINSFVKPFDLSKAPLMRAGLAKVAETRYAWMFDMHHTIYDGASMRVFIKEFMALYMEKSLPSLRIQYRDFSQWQNSRKGKEMLQKQKEYWLHELSGDLPELNLPTDYERPELQSFAGSYLTFSIGKEETTALKTMADRENATLFMVLLALFNVLLSKLSGQQDIIIGTPVLGRRHADLHQLIGMLANAMALRNYPAAEKTFNGFLTEIRDRTFNAFENQDFQFEELVGLLPGQRDVRRNPVFDVMFVYDNLDTTERRNGESGNAGGEKGLNLEYHNLQNDISHFDLMFVVREGEDSIGIMIEYSTALFKRDTVERIAGHFNDILEQVINNEDIQLKGISISHDFLEAKSTVFQEEEQDDWLN